MNATIAFDLDGTLIDSVGHIHHGVSQALEEMDLPPISRDDTQGFVGRGLPILLQQVLDHIGAPQAHHAELSRRTMEHYVGTPSDPASVYPGARDALSALKAQGYRLTLCTNKPIEATRAALRDTGLDGFFDIVVGGDSLSTRKPDPEMLFAALDGAENALYVGDSETDAETAQRGKVAFLLYTEGYRKTPVEALPHTARFSDFTDLLALVQRYL
ncbi:HAD-IA family hydrolase [Antarctobacter heliothermus]|uniref:phosphoglycolate phosphatase n=1 Tax=Antarctobacter heliothermus TaxID=74033 RepID=A0A239DSS7_9RHOB|nr:HAD-IA family hydrolase [Antarctobacter heliothermus]SNS35550.1 phosphoglycolate phosphatase [Antarctobacter heliothermus]